MKNTDFPYLNDSPLDLSGREGYDHDDSATDELENDSTGDKASTITISRVEYDALRLANQHLRDAREALQIVVDSFAASRRASIDVGVGVTYSEQQWQMREPLYMKAVRAALETR